MQHPAVMSSFPPHWPVWLQFCQSWACSVAFKITMTFFDNAHMCKTEAKKLKKFTHVFSPLYTNVKHESEIRTDTHTCEHEYYFSYLMYSLHPIFPLRLLLYSHTLSHDPKFSASPRLSWHEQKASIYPPMWELLSLLIFPAHSNTWREHMYYVAFVSVSHSGNEAPEMCPCCVMSVCVFQWVTCQMWSVLLQKKKTKNVMKVALPAVKRIQCSVEAQIQLALWAPWNGDNTGWLCQQASNLS